MGCFTVLKCNKKKFDLIMRSKCATRNECVPTALPEPQTHTPTLQSTPSSFVTRVEPIHPISQVTNDRTRVLSAPSALDAAEQDALASIEYQEQEVSKPRARSMKEQRSPSPQPLPLPSPPGGCVLKATRSLKMASGPLYADGSALDAAEQDDLASVENEEQEVSKYRARSMKEQRSAGPQPQPLPLPYPQGGVALKVSGSFKSGTGSGPLYDSGRLPFPPTGSLCNFLYEEIAAACHNFSPDRCMSECLSSTIYKASFKDEASITKKLKATVTCLHSSTQGLREFINEVNTLASLQHPNLCKLLGFHARNGSEPRMLVYERLCHGSLDRLLFGGYDGPSIDWNTRMKIALCAAQGLTFLHEEGPFQAMYNEFSTANIQIDIDFSAKLSGYGCVGHIPEEEISSNLSAVGNLPVETLERGMLTPKSNVWSFGIVLLELLTGRKNQDIHHPKEERDLIKLCRPFLTDDFRLSLIMDPQLKGRYPSMAARTVGDIVQRCLQKEPSERPTMRTIVEKLQMIQDMKFSCLFPLQEPSRIQMSRSPSLNGIPCHAPRTSFSRSPSLARASFSPPGLFGGPTFLSPPRVGSSNFSIAELYYQGSRKLSPSSSRSSSFEGY